MSPGDATGSMPDPEPLAQRLLHALAAQPGERASLPRLGKQLGHSASVLMRTLSALGDASIGGVAGPGWVRVDQEAGRWVAQLTDAGRAAVHQASGPDRPDDDPAPLPAALQSCAVEVHRHGAAPQRSSDAVAAEVPVALVFNGLSHAVMMATPQDLEAFAVGFALSEGIVLSAADCRDVAVRALADRHGACEVAIDIPPRAFAGLKDRRRSLAGRTGCGVCGIDSLAALDLAPARMPARPDAAPIPPDAIARAFAAMAPLQRLNAQAGSLHAAAWCTPEGVPTDVLEDVGRHNALDKLLGRLALAGRLGDAGFVAMTSRASYELVGKCARLGVGTLATISAPTTLAIRMADAAGLQLWGLCRGSRAVRYGNL